MRLRRVLRVIGFEGSNTRPRKGHWQRAKIELIVDFEGERHCDRNSLLSFCLPACHFLLISKERLIYKGGFPLELRALIDFSLWVLTLYIDSPPESIPAIRFFVRISKSSVLRPEVLSCRRCGRFAAFTLDHLDHRLDCLASKSHCCIISPSADNKSPSSQSRCASSHDYGTLSPRPCYSLACCRLKSSMASNVELYRLAALSAKAFLCILIIIPGPVDFQSL